MLKLIFISGLLNIFLFSNTNSIPNIKFFVEQKDLQLKIWKTVKDKEYFYNTEIFSKNSSFHSLFLLSTTKEFNGYFIGHNYCGIKLINLIFLDIGFYIWLDENKNNTHDSNIYKLKFEENGYRLDPLDINAFLFLENSDILDIKVMLEVPIYSKAAGNRIAFDPYLGFYRRYSLITEIIPSSFNVKIIFGQR